MALVNEVRVDPSGQDLRYQMVVNVYNGKTDDTVTEIGLEDIEVAERIGNLLSATIAAFPGSFSYRSMGGFVVGVNTPRGKIISRVSIVITDT